MIDRSKLGIREGFSFCLKYELIIHILKILRHDYFKNKILKSKECHNNIVISTGIGVGL